MQKPTIYWEDFHIGEIAQYGAYHVSRDEMLAFAREFDPQDNHINEEAAKQSLLGGLSASGWHTASMAIRIIHDGLTLNSAFVGDVGIDELRWQRPVYAEDILSVRRICRDSQPSTSRPETGLIHFVWEVLNQRDDIVMTMTTWSAYLCRAHAH
jgi:acyl dehydratase